MHTHTHTSGLVDPKACRGRNCDRPLASAIARRFFSFDPSPLFCANPVFLSHRAIGRANPEPSPRPPSPSLVGSPSTRPASRSLPLTNPQTRYSPWCPLGLLFASPVESPSMPCVTLNFSVVLPRRPLPHCHRQAQADIAIYSPSFPRATRLLFPLSTISSTSSPSLSLATLFPGSVRRPYFRFHSNHHTRFSRLCISFVGHQSLTSLDLGSFA